MEKVLAIIMAGGVGERLQPLTLERAKAAVPFGGKFRLIDFTLSNCINSGLRRIYVLTQYMSESLNRHIQEGWSISSAGLGDFIYCMPAQQKMGLDWYRGTADAVRQNVDLILRENPDEVVILSGDHVYKMDYLQLVRYHREKKADVTLAAVRATKEEAARRLGVLETDGDGRLIGFEEKPAEPKTLQEAPGFALGSMGVYVFSAPTLLEALQGDEDDFGKHIIPSMIGGSHNIFVYDFARDNRIQDFTFDVHAGIRKKVLVERSGDSSYWRDVGTIDSYFEASMDLVAVDPLFSLYGEKWPIRTCQKILPPSKVTLYGKATDSMICDGAIVSGGTVWNSILSPGVIVEKGAVVEQSIVFDDVVIEPGARVKRAIIDKWSRLRAGCCVGYDAEADRAKGFTVTDSGITVVPIRTEICPDGLEEVE